MDCSARNESLRGHYRRLAKNRLKRWVFKRFL